MPINTGYLQSEVTDSQDRTVSARVYYDQTFLPMGATQPLTNGKSGFCLEVTNAGGVDADVILSHGDDWPDLVVSVGPGLLPALLSAGRTRVDLALAGFNTRGDVAGLMVRTNY